MCESQIREAVAAGDRGAFGSTRKGEFAAHSLSEELGSLGRGYLSGQLGTPEDVETS